jgi:hypothetical protein
MMVYTEARDETAVCSGTEIEDSRRRWLGRKKSESTLQFQKVTKCGERECGA